MEEYINEKNLLKEFDKCIEKLDGLTHSMNIDLVQKYNTDDRVMRILRDSQKVRKILYGISCDYEKILNIDDENEEDILPF